MLATDDKPYDLPGHRPIDALRQGIRFDDVTFGYADGLSPALSGVTFEIPAGRTTALVGASGAGKTTIINLLLRLYSPQQGAITVDGLPLQEVLRVDWLALLGVAGQDVDLIEGTVLDNIRMANAGASHERLLDAAHMAGVAEFVDTLPDGYETWIGQQAHRFSSGQRQRLGLARALLRDPQLLILDEAMSELDADLERRIRQAIDERFARRTVLIISHHAATVREPTVVGWTAAVSLRTTPQVTALASSRRRPRPPGADGTSRWCVRRPARRSRRPPPGQHLTGKRRSGVGCRVLRGVGGTRGANRGKHRWTYFATSSPALAVAPIFSGPRTRCRRSRRSVHARRSHRRCRSTARLRSVAVDGDGQARSPG